MVKFSQKAINQHDVTRTTGGEEGQPVSVVTGPSVPSSSLMMLSCDNSCHGWHKAMTYGGSAYWILYAIYAGLMFGRIKLLNGDELLPAVFGICGLH